jgi:Protein of unknown function (DUF998)
MLGPHIRYWSVQYQQEGKGHARLMAHLLAAPASAPSSTTSSAFERAAGLTRPLLACGALAGPLYLAVGLAQALTRPGFDLRRHELSQLAVGDWGWVQIANFYVVGLLVIASAVGLNRVLGAQKGSTWVPRLVALYGVGLLGAGLFTADAGLGFPPGTPADAMSITTHGLLHFAFAAAGFCGVIGASIVLGRRYVSVGQPGAAAHSIATGVLFLATFVAGGALSGAEATRGFATLLLWIGVLLAWSWLSVTCARFLVND